MAIRALLYSADEPDQEPDLSAIYVDALTPRQLLWLDLSSPDASELAQVARIVSCQPGLLDLVADSPRQRASLANHGQHFRVAVQAVSLERAKTELEHTPLTLVVGHNVVVTVHEGGIDFLDTLRKRERGETAIGALASESFAASLLDWLLDTYFLALEVLVHDIDRVEVAILGRKLPPQTMDILLAARRRLAELRRLLKSHRDVFYGLARPDFLATEQPETRPHFEALSQHYDRAQDDLDSARELVIGSFGLLSTRATQKTNDTMGALTFATVLMGILALIAGLMGMNFQIPVYEEGLPGFLVVLGVMALISVAAVWAGFKRGWI